MDLDVSARYTCREALAHPWIAEGAASDINIANSVATQMRKHFIKKKWRQAYNATAVIRKMRLLALASTTQSQDLGSPGEHFDDIYASNDISTRVWTLFDV